jgi:hypothetical protein
MSKRVRIPVLKKAVNKTRCSLHPVNSNRELFWTIINQNIIGKLETEFDMKYKNLNKKLQIKKPNNAYIKYMNRFYTYRKCNQCHLHRRRNGTSEQRRKIQSAP